MTKPNYFIETEQSSLLHGKETKDGSKLESLFQKPEGPNVGSIKRERPHNDRKFPVTTLHHLFCADPPTCTRQELQGTLIGSTVFLLYQVVFCLAQAATITRPHASHSSTGVMAQMAALGIMTAGPFFLFELADQVPAIYPASDLFLAPFLAKISNTIDQILLEHGKEDDDKVFLATFGLLITTGFLLSGIGCILAARFKLANLGAFLPHSVLCGFFSTIGILMWTLGFSVDVGKTIGEVILSGSWSQVRYAVLHHMPSVCVGILMHILGPKHPLYVVLLVFCAIGGSYLVMWVSHTSLADAQAQNWFFSPDDLTPNYPTLSVKEYALPAPGGVWFSIWRGDVVWEAFFAGLPPMMSLVFLYLVRSSLHAAALKKNIPHVTRKEEQGETLLSPQERSNRRNKKREPLTLNFILEHGYGYSQLVSGLLGGIAIAPSVAASLTLFKLRAERPPPQYGSCFLVLIFYFSNFALVQYIPKPAFSALMVLAGLDMLKTWIYDSYFKTKAKAEWMVGPSLIILSFTIGVLNAIFAGIALSTFIFAANFYNAGAVKFVGNGLALRSSVERGVLETEWLSDHGDLIQILVVQNYLFFGNSQSLFVYISTMFEDEESTVLEIGDTEAATGIGWRNSVIPPKPKYLVVDFSLVSGMDTSAVDLMRDIISLCESHRCKLYLSGLEPSMKSNLFYAGLQPSHDGHEEKRWVYTYDMETALAKAEDALLSTEFHLEERNQKETNLRLSLRKNRILQDGDDEKKIDLIYALQKIDEQHGLNTALELAEISRMTQLVQLDTGDVLVQDIDHGLYFVETGLLRVQWSKGSTRRSGYVHSAPRYSVDASIGRMNARSATIGRETLLWKEQQHARHQHSEQTFRLARIGQGWIIGGIEVANGMKQPGVHVAMSPCRLHHLPRSAIKELEYKNPLLAMHLYRMVSHLSTKRQEMTIEHLGQHLQILNSPVPRLRGRGKAKLAMIQMHHF